MQKPICLYVHEPEQRILIQYFDDINIPFECATTYRDIFEAIEQERIDGVIINATFMATPEGEQVMQKIRHHIPSITLMEQGSEHYRWIERFVDLPHHDYSRVRRSADGLDTVMKRTGMIKDS